MKMSNETYDRLKWVALFFLPALATLCCTVMNQWGIPHVEQVVGTITAVDAFLGALLGVSSEQYKQRLKDANKK